jgi:hypothetical protein
MNEIHLGALVRETGGLWGNACGLPLGYHEMRTNRLADVTCRGCRQAGEWAERVRVVHSDMDWGGLSRATVRLLAEDERLAYRYVEWIAEGETLRPGERGSWAKTVRAWHVRRGGTLGQARNAVLLAAHEAALVEDIARDTKVLLANFTPLPASRTDVEDLRLRVAALEAAVQRLSGEAGTRVGGAPVNAAQDASAAYTVLVRTYEGHGRGVHDFEPSLNHLCTKQVIHPGGTWRCGEPIKSAIHDPEGYAAYAAELKSALDVWQDKTFLF